MKVDMKGNRREKGIYFGNTVNKKEKKGWRTNTRIKEGRREISDNKEMHAYE